MCVTSRAPAAADAHREREKGCPVLKKMGLGDAALVRALYDHELPIVGPPRAKF